MDLLPVSECVGDLVKDSQVAVSVSSVEQNGCDVGRVGVDGPKDVRVLPEGRGFPSSTVVTPVPGTRVSGPD